MFKIQVIDFNTFRGKLIDYFLDINCIPNDDNISKQIDTVRGTLPTKVLIFLFLRETENSLNFCFLNI
jgi:hypothetical protein